MPFGKGQPQPSKKRRGQTKDRFSSKTSRKQARGHWQSEQERFVRPQQARNYDDDDRANDDSDDNEYDYYDDEEEESKDGSEEFDNDCDEEDGKAWRGRKLGMDEKKSLGIDCVKEEEVRVISTCTLS